MMLIFPGNENQDSSVFFHNPADKQAELKTQSPWLNNKLISNILQTHIILPTKQKSSNKPTVNEMNFKVCQSFGTY